MASTVLQNSLELVFQSKFHYLHLRKKYIIPMFFPLLFVSIFCSVFITSTVIIFLKNFFLLLWLQKYSCIYVIYLCMKPQSTLFTVAMWTGYYGPCITPIKHLYICPENFCNPNFLHRAAEIPASVVIPKLSTISRDSDFLLTYTLSFLCGFACGHQYKKVMLGNTRGL